MATAGSAHDGLNYPDFFPSANISAAFGRNAGCYFYFAGNLVYPRHGTKTAYFCRFCRTDAAAVLYCGMDQTVQRIYRMAFNRRTAGFMNSPRLSFYDPDGLSYIGLAAAAALALQTVRFKWGSEPDNRLIGLLLLASAALTTMALASLAKFDLWPAVLAIEILILGALSHLTKIKNPDGRCQNRRFPVCVGPTEKYSVCAWRHFVCAAGNPGDEVLFPCFRLNGALLRFLYHHSGTGICRAGLDRQGQMPPDSQGRRRCP